jgi:hypothetical protein
MKLTKLNELPEKGVSHNARIRKREWVANGELGPITTYARAVFPPGEKAGAHSHADLAEVFTAESGAGEIRINDVLASLWVDFVFLPLAICPVFEFEAHGMGAGSMDYSALVLWYAATRPIKDWNALR